MFKLSQSDTYSWPVRVSFPIDGGRYHHETFDAVFKRISQSRLKDLTQSDSASDVDYCNEVLVGWKGIFDDNGNDVPFSESAREKLLDIPAVAKAIVLAHLDSVSGAKRKN